MAIKKYGYYLKGNRFAIAQEGSGSHCSLSGYNDKSSCEAAGGTWYGSASFGSSDDYGYKSPLDSVTDGIEIEYTYAPTYRNFKENVPYDNLWASNGWTVIDGYVCFVSGGNINKNEGETGYGTADWNTINSASTEGDTGGQNLDYIEVRGSSRWSGIHRIQTAYGDGNTLGGGILKTYTKADVKMPALFGVDIDWQAQGAVGTLDAHIYGDAASNLFLGEIGIESGDFFFVSGFAANIHNGVFKCSDTTESTTEAGTVIEVQEKYVLNAKASAQGKYNEEVIHYPSEVGGSSRITASESGDSNSVICKIVHEIMDIRTDVNVLNDENDEIDLTPYQSRAVVYYVKAMMSEDAGDFEKREYFMRLFKKQLEKERSGRKRGPYIAMGNSNMRIR